MRLFLFVAISTVACCVFAQDGFPGGDLINNNNNDQSQLQQPPPSSVVAPAAATAPAPLLTLTTSGATLLDANGVSAGNIEGVVIDPVTGQLQYALVSMWYPGNRSMVTPVPWNVVSPSLELRAPGAFQRFTVPLDRTALTRAPRINLQQPGALTNSAAWTSSAQAFFAPLGVGTVGSIQPGTGVETGAFIPANFEQAMIAGSNLLGSNFLMRVFGTNVAITNQLMADTMFPALRSWFATNRVPWPYSSNISGPAFAATNSAIFPRSTNTLPAAFPPALGAPGSVPGTQAGADNATRSDGIIDNTGVPPGGTPGTAERGTPRRLPPTIQPDVGTPLPERIPQTPPPPANATPPSASPPPSAT